MAPDPSIRVRRAAVAGSWYPDDARRLATSVDELLSPAVETRSAPPRALVVPHAGMRYSGATAARAFATVPERSFARVLVLAPSHRAPLRGAAVEASTHYETPLGRIAVDVEATELLGARRGFTRTEKPFALEHAIEMELPFVQRRLPDAKLVPVLVGETRGGEAERLADALAALVDAATLVVVSSDFVHYGPSYDYVPFSGDIPRNIQELDRTAVSTLVGHDATGFDAFLERSGATICGRRPLGVFLRFVPPGWQAELLQYATSGDITGDWTHSVSYVALAYRERSADVVPLSAGERSTLLGVARRAVLAAAAGGDANTALEGVALTERLRSKSGVFVGLHRRRDGRLRGCIGSVVPRQPLAEAVAESARAAASRDPRFDAVAPHEVADLAVEISVLGAVEPATSIDDIVIGRHGLIVTQEHARGVLLPQVAVEHRWSRESFLENTCRKADLPPDAWKIDAFVERFEAEVFAEE